MNTDRNLLFGVLALQADLIDADQFIKVCTLWTTRKHTALGDLLIELGWITPTDRADVERLLERKLKRHGGDPRAGLADVSDDVKRSLAACKMTTFSGRSASCRRRSANQDGDGRRDSEASTERYQPDSFACQWRHRTHLGGARQRLRS